MVFHQTTYKLLSEVRKKMNNLMRTIFNSVSNRVLSPITLPEKWKNISADKLIKQFVIYLAIADDTKRAKVIIGKGSDIQEAITSAINNWIKLGDQSLKVKHVKVDLVKKVRIMKRFGNLKSKLTIDTGIDGLAFDKDFALSFSPQEVEAYKLVKDRKINLERIAFAINNQLIPGDSASLQTQKHLKLYKFTTESFYANEKEEVCLVRGHRIFNKLTRGDLEEAIKLTQKNYFIKVINKKGKQKYSYLPHIDLNEKRYNILRHAGTIYSILESIELFHSDSLLKKSQLSLEFLIRKMEKREINGKDTLVLVERDVLKLGGNALAIVALAKYTSLTSDKQYIPVMQKLATWIKETQADNGDFMIHKQTYSNEKIFSFRSDFYTGEAILALVRLYELDNNEMWLDAAEKATDFLVNNKNKNATEENVHFDHWLLYGINNLTRYRPNDSFFAHAMLIGKSLIKKQYIGDKYPEEWQGGFPPEVGKYPKSVPVACRSEGLANIYNMIKDKDSEFAKEIKQTFRLAVEFQMQMQLRDEKVMYFENKKLTLGAFHNKFKDIELRNDFTQHNISSLVALYKYL